jgi:hypothetical protein
MMKNISMLFLLLLILAASPVSSSATLVDDANFSNEVILESDALELNWYHFTFYDPECGNVTVDGWVNWNSPSSHDGFCIDVTSDNCDDFNVSGLQVPSTLINRNGTIRTSTLMSYAIGRN